MVVHHCAREGLLAWRDGGFGMDEGCNLVNKSRDLVRRSDDGRIEVVEGSARPAVAGKPVIRAFWLPILA